MSDWDIVWTPFTFGMLSLISDLSEMLTIIIYLQLEMDYQIIARKRPGKNGISEIEHPNAGLT